VEDAEVLQSLIADDCPTTEICDFAADSEFMPIVMLGKSSFVKGRIS